MKQRESSTTDQVGTLAELIRQARLVWRLLLDPRISPFLKGILPITLVYLVLPWDLLPDTILGLGQLDDLAIILLGVRLFLQLCPDRLIAEHRRDLANEEEGTANGHEEGDSSAQQLESPARDKYLEQSDKIE
jgi:uncharacterized membrane protein YkvA (DUF1232 family)